MEDLSKKCLSYCLRIVSMRDYSEFKLKEKLRERGYPAEIVTNSIEEMKKFGYMKEENYRQAKIKMRFRQGKSSRLIIEELKQEKITVTNLHIEEALSDLNLSEDVILKTIIHKKIKNAELKNLDYESKIKLERKLMSTLIRHGYEFTKIKKMLNSVINESNNDLN